MLKNLKDLYGARLGAADGDIGYVKDFYFDDHAWALRYLLADAPKWLPARQLLFSPLMFGSRPFGFSEADPKILRVSLNRTKIEESPVIASGRAVSRADEEAYYAYHGLKGHWHAAPVAGEPRWPTPGPWPVDHLPSLRSTKALDGYVVNSTDGPVGHVRGLRADDQTWQIREIAIDTGPWYARRSLYLSPANVIAIDHDKRSLFVNLPTRDFRGSMRDDVVQPDAGFH